MCGEGDAGDRDLIAVLGDDVDKSLRHLGGRRALGDEVAQRGELVNLG